MQLPQAPDSSGLESSNTQTLPHQSDALAAPKQHRCFLEAPQQAPRGTSQLGTLCHCLSEI